MKKVNAKDGFKAPKKIDYLLCFYKDRQGTPNMTVYSDGGDLNYRASMMVFAEALANDEGSLLDEDDRINLEKLCRYYLHVRGYTIEKVTSSNSSNRQ